MSIDSITSIDIRGTPAWVVVLSTIIVALETKRLAALRHIRQSDDSRYAVCRARGQRLGVSARFATFVVLAGMLCFRIAWAGIPLAVLLAHTGLRPAWQFAKGFATGFAETSARTLASPLVAMIAAGYFVLGRGLLALLAFIAFLVLGDVWAR